jgi:hypothetical protein
MREPTSTVIVSTNKIGEAISLPQKWRCGSCGREALRQVLRDTHGGPVNGGRAGTARQEGASNGIRAVAITPGPFLTPASDRDLGDNQAARDAITRKTLLKRFGQPEEVAELTAFIASDRASYITGANYPVDGGATAW